MGQSHFTYYNTWTKSAHKGMTLVFFCPLFLKSYISKFPWIWNFEFHVEICFTKSLSLGFPMRAFHLGNIFFVSFFLKQILLFYPFVLWALNNFIWISLWIFNSKSFAMTFGPCPKKWLIGPKNTLSFWLWCSTTKSMSTWDTIIYCCKIFKWWILISYVIFQHN